jgi:hypothetical protein
MLKPSLEFAGRNHRSRENAFSEDAGKVRPGMYGLGSTHSRAAARTLFDQKFAKEQWSVLLLGEREGKLAQVYVLPDGTMIGELVT